MVTSLPPIRFFLGSNTPTGFFDTTDTLYAPENWQVYILKGGAGTGKSTLLRRLYEKLTANGHETEVFCCSADPNSFDAIRCSAKHLCVIDGTAPHVVEPRYWNASEQIVPLSVCVGTRLQPYVSEIVSLTDKNRTLHSRCREYLQAAATLLFENRRLQESCLACDKLTRFAHRLAITEWQSGSHPAKPMPCEQRFLSAFTPNGWRTFYDTLQALCPRIYVIEDEYGAVGSPLLSRLQKLAATDGIRCIACPCPLFPTESYEHLLLPELGIAFTVSNSFHKVDFPVFRRIHAARFLDTERLRQHRARFSFQRKAATEILQEATALSAQAKSVHDQLEAYSTAAMDWNHYEQLCDDLLKSI